MARKDSSVSPYLLRPLRTLEHVLRSRAGTGESASEYAEAFPTRDARGSPRTGADRSVQPRAYDAID